MTVKAVLYGLAIAMAATTHGVAEARIDTRIDEAARGIVAARMGDLRGGLAPGEEPVFVWQEAGQKKREPLKVLQYGRYRDDIRTAPQSKKAH